MKKSKPFEIYVYYAIITVIFVHIGIVACINVFGGHIRNLPEWLHVIAIDWEVENQKLLECSFFLFCIYPVALILWIYNKIEDLGKEEKRKPPMFNRKK